MFPFLGRTQRLESRDWKAEAVAAWQDQPDHVGRCPVYIPRTRTLVKQTNMVQGWYKSEHQQGVDNRLGTTKSLSISNDMPSTRMR